jgi:ribose/xylose/arabinose/galactoside ABC-type transport system permease subunit
MFGVVLGVLFIDTLANGFVHWGFTTDQVRMTNGGVLVLAAGMQAFAAWVAGRTAGHPLPFRLRAPLPGARRA